MSEARKRIVLLLWKVGIKGKPCQCSFYEASHYNKELEFDLNFWPCKKFIRMED